MIKTFKRRGEFCLAMWSGRCSRQKGQWRGRGTGTDVGTHPSLEQGTEKSG